MSSIFKPCRFKSRGTAATGPTPISSGSTPAVTKPRKMPSGLRPFCAPSASLMTRQADAPSIISKTVGVVHVFVAGKPTEHRLPQQSDQRMATILAGPRIGEHLTSQHGQAKRVVKFAIGEQPGIGGDDTAAKLQRQAAVKIEPKGTRI